MIAGARAAQLTMVTVSSSYPAFGHVTRWSPGLAHPVALTLQEAVCGFMSASHNSRSQTRTNLSSTRWCDVPTVGLIYASSMVLVDSAHRKAPVPALTLAAAIRACSSARTGARRSVTRCSAFPEVVRSAVVMSVPHPATTRESLLRAEHVHRSFHWFFFQLPQLPERALRADGYAFVDWLWDYWTAPGFTDEEHLAEVKRMLAVPGALEATLGYYRAMFDPARADPDLAEVRQAAGRPIVVPTLALCGAEDKRAEVMQDQARHFAGPYRFELVPGSGHFLQREQPQAVTELVLDWFARQ